MSGMDGKVAVILGASTQDGIGAAVARSFVRAGARVVLAARRLEGVQEVAREIGGDAVQCDATQESAIESLVGTAIAMHGKLDIAVDVAGGHASESLDAITRETLLRIFDINVVAPALFIKHCARAMKAGGSIVIVSSHSSQLTTPKVAPYACTKAAVERLVEVAALEYGPRGIRVNTLSPSMLDTPMSAQFLSVTGMRRAYEKETPLGRLATVDEVAAGVLYLASDNCFTTGDRLRVGGGVHLRRFPQPDDFPPD
jgi:NAD(P)-dependent dehydrogenase (short-subunit alcohol dehydrogenase family)